MVSARAAAAGMSPDLEMNDRCVVSGVDVPGFQLLRTRPGHRRELGHLTESPRSAACMIRLNSRSNRSRGLRLLMSGARPGAAAGSRRWPCPAPPAAATRSTPCTRCRPPAAGRALRQPSTPCARTRRWQAALPLTGCPHRWQKRAWGDSSARQAAQARGVRLAPHELQKFPLAGCAAGGTGHAEGGDGNGRRSVNGKR